MDTVFYITAIFIFAAALTGLFVNRCRRDRVVEVTLQRIGLEDGVPPPEDLPPLPDVELVIESEREVDVCLPRSVGVVRHGGERP